MNNSTSTTRGWLKSAMLLLAVGSASLVANSQTFCYDGLIYKAGTGTKATELTIMKPGTTVTVGDKGPTAYSGDYKIPATIDYDGKTYHVSAFSAATFKGQQVTSIEFAEGSIVQVPRAALANLPTLKSVKLNSDVTDLAQNCFQNSTGLEEITIPGKVAALNNGQFAGCTGLKKITFEEGPTPIVFTVMAFKLLEADTDGAHNGIVEVVFNRQVDLTSTYQAMNMKAFRGAKALTTLTIGGNFETIPASYFENATLLNSVTITNQPKEFGTNLFANTGLTEFTYPASLTSVPGACFMNCKQLAKVTLPEGLTTISSQAFQGSTLAEINFPSTLASIGDMAFSGTKLTGELMPGANVKTLGQQSFASNKGITNVNLPATVTKIGDGAFYNCTGVTRFEVAAENTAYKTAVEGRHLTDIEGTTLVAYAPAAEGTELSGDYTALSPYAAFKASKLTSVNLPACVNWGDYSLSSTGVQALSLRGNIGRYVAKGTPMTSLTLDQITEVPQGVAMDCASLTDVTIKTPFTIVKQDAFNGTTALKSLNLGNIVAILEADCFANSGLNALTVAAAVPAGMSEGVFTEQSNITVTVPVDLVDTYKGAAGWNLLNIVGDANLAQGPADMGMPNGLYYAGEDGHLHAVYADGGTDTYDVGGAAHTFQLSQFKNRIYGASAGKKFTYTGNNATEGDGKLFYISQVGGNIFQAVVLDNYGLNAYKDPFGLYIYGEDLFVSDRNVAIRKVKADAIALDSKTYPSWMENNWMGFYNQEWSYGNIKCGWAITTGANGNPEYWLGIKYNGNGIYRFQDEHIGSAAGVGTRPEKGVFLNKCNPIFTTLYIDEANKHLYMYLETDGGDETTMSRAGLYRLDLTKLEANPDPTLFKDAEPLLIDGSPVKFEGSATNEHVGISQLSPDEKGEYLYWCYRAPTAAEAATQEGQDFIAQKSGKYWWADKFDASNPLHQSGIKRIKLGEENPTVEMVAPGVSGYGVVPVNFEGSTKPDQGVQTIVTNNVNDVLVVNGANITVQANATLAVYNMNGLMVVYQAVAEGETVTVDQLPAGAYIVTATVTNGQTATAKLVK